MFSKRTDCLLRRLNITVSSIGSYQYCIYKPYCTHPQMNIFELIRGIYVGHLGLAFYFIHIILNLWTREYVFTKRRYMYVNGFFSSTSLFLLSILNLWRNKHTSCTCTTLPNPIHHNSNSEPLNVIRF